MCAHLGECRTHHRQFRNISCCYCPQGAFPGITQLLGGKGVAQILKFFTAVIYIHKVNTKRPGDVNPAFLWFCYCSRCRIRSPKSMHTEINTADTPLHPKDSMKCQAKSYKIPLASFMTFWQGGIDIHHV